MDLDIKGIYRHEADRCQIYQLVEVIIRNERIV